MINDGFYPIMSKIIEDSTKTLNVNNYFHNKRALMGFETRKND